MAENIRLHGWNVWSVNPANGATGSVAILGALYAMFGADPSLISPINAAVHALGGTLIFRIGELLAPGKVGRIAGICAATLFVCFPSALNWYGQVHKDGFAIAGVLVLIHSWLSILVGPVNRKSMATSVLSAIAAVLLIGFVRPYNLIPLFAVMLFLFLASLGASIYSKTGTAKKLGALCLSVIILATGAVWSKHQHVAERYSYDADSWASLLTNWTWKPSTWLPKPIEGYVEIAARTRTGLIQSGIREHAGSMIDTDKLPDNVEAVVAYAPRALQIALFAPFPSSWFEKISPTRIVSILESIVWYLIAPGVLLALLFRRSEQLFAVLGFATLFLYIYGFAIANIGTLYRIRYPYLFLFIVVGIIGWLELFQRRHWPPFKLTTAPALFPSSPGHGVSRSKSGTSHGKLVGAGILVGVFTALGYTALFLRDILLARWFGTGAALDAFFVATTVPMFLVTVMSIPIGTMLVPQYLNAQEQFSKIAAQQLISKISFIYLLLVSAAAAMLWVGSVPLLHLIASNFSTDKLGLSQSILCWMLPILVLSGLVIMNNALLNVMGRYTVPSAAQIAPPLFSILSLLLFGKSLGVAAVIAGMLIGQVFNLWLVAYILGKYGLSIRPRWSNGEIGLGPALAQYVPLVAAALFVNLSTPVNLSMASRLAEGSVAAFGLGNKIVMLASGLIAAAVATVILPYFSSLMARNRLLDARNELSFFLVAATVVTIPITLLLFISAEPIVAIIFKGGAFDEDAVHAVAKVMSYGIIQLPFFSVNLLILKFAIASRLAGRVMVASLFGLCVNIALNFLLMENSGVAGIALATTLAMAMAAGLMLLMFHRLGHISWVDMIMIALSWMIYTTVVICLHYESYPGVIASLLALITLLYGQWNLLVRWREET